MMATRSLLQTVAQNPVARSALFRNTAVTSMSVRRFNASPANKEQCAAAESEILRQQRKVRPVSPHLEIYQPQITWYLSGLHRITGAAIGGGFYLGALGYLAAPALGYPIDAATVVSAAASAPVALKVLAKGTIAFPFVFHSLNGIRHLAWDVTKFIDIKSVYTTGYAVLAGTAVGTAYLASL
ncbi:succinate dehydrogenase flavoprotein subunit 3 SDH3 [Phycomyces blakesleeanus]|uniref:Succinate dehydrogenase flavo protein subunit 3 SDH3 n=2 Tax=Phycomyces blakesleeanus TaxID=4837 RepID=A0A162Y4Z2_PHYB8|nr:succinate dehydrogenase flavo protein subunit 3 SDH3 [Phycomyces blakesleeanus NRRL 1555(-)]OAD78325.1 succinate dehydrogenase flavo protein subunit 3 SDH3 [Phycomyces blakesleeanus NRRL 1555(-)]|eukprot:XP_018296365.1 succinate dehydrogenase flavo protein subunit 3 SDH3 [Phycomyces blakesleeanus NRRL 1555(-)]